MKAADALREAGYAPLPRLWVPLEHAVAIIRWADQYAGEVNRIRGEAGGAVESAPVPVFRSRRKPAPE